jgi:hypothetical protein
VAYLHHQVRADGLKSILGRDARSALLLTYVRKGDPVKHVRYTERLVNWLELPFDIAVAFFGGLLSVYAFIWCVYLIRDRWWPWVQGR